MPSAMSTMVEAPAIHKTETFQGVDRNDFAYRFMQKQGWSEGQGLGKDKSGISKHIWTKKRADQVGIGAENSNDWGAHSVQTNSYNSLLSKLDVVINNSESETEEEKPAKSKKSKKDKKKKGKKKESSAEDESEGEAPKKSEKKKAKEPVSDSDSDSDMEQQAASSSVDDQAARKGGRSYAAAAVMARRFAYKRQFMNKTKDVKSYSSEDLSQILGFSVSTDEDKAQKEGLAKFEAVVAAPSDSEESEEDPEPKKKKKSKNKGEGEKDQSPKKSKESNPEDKKEKKKEKKAKEAKAKEDPGPPLVQSELTGYLKMMFTAGGFLNNYKREKTEQDWVFDEATQEKIATSAHEHKVENRKGLGFDNDRPTKLGKDFKGEKKTFDSDDEDEEEVKAKKDKKEKKKKRKQAEAEAEDEEVEEPVKKKKKKKDKSDD